MIYPARLWFSKALQQNASSHPATAASKWGNHVKQNKKEKSLVWNILP